MHKRNEANNSNGYAKPYLFSNYNRTQKKIINSKRALKKVRNSIHIMSIVFQFDGIRALDQQ